MLCFDIYVEHDNSVMYNSKHYEQNIPCTMHLTLLKLKSTKFP